MDFSLNSELQSLRDRTRRFIHEEIMPMEAGPATDRAWTE